MIWRTGAEFQFLFNSATCSNFSETSYVNILVFHFFEKVNKGHFKMVNVNYYKWSDLTFHYVAMPMVTSQILKSVDFTKTEKSRYLKKENFFVLIKKNH